MKARPKWQRKLHASDLRHLAETTRRNTLSEVKKNLAHQKTTGIICDECRAIAQKLKLEVEA